MHLRILFFASYRELLGSGEMSLELQAPATVSDLLREIRSRGEPYDSLPVSPVVAVNREAARQGALGTGFSPFPERPVIPRRFASTSSRVSR